MRVGIVGFAGSGKSTLFQLLTGTRPDPGKIHAGQVGVATLSDPRLDYLATLHKPKKVTPATVEFLDTPGPAGRLARRQPPAPRPDPRRGRPLDRLERIRRRRPGSPARRISRRTALRRPERRHQPRRAAGSQRQESPARPRAIAQGARNHQGRAGGPRRGQDGRHARALGRRQEAAPIVRPLDRQAPGGPPQHAPGPGRPGRTRGTGARGAGRSTPSSSSSSRSSSPTNARRS